MKQLLGKIDTALSGRAAEIHKYGSLGKTSGAASDLKQATSIANKMVKVYGMSEEVRSVELNRITDNSDLMHTLRLVFSLSMTMASRRTKYRWLY